MINLIGNLPLWVIVIVLTVCEVGIAFLLIKKKFDYDKSLRSFIWLLAFVVPAFATGKIIQSNKIAVIGENISNTFILIISAVFVIGLIVLSINKLRSDEATTEQRRFISFALIGFSFCVVVAICITIYEKFIQI